MAENNSGICWHDEEATLFSLLYNLGHATGKETAATEFYGEPIINLSSRVHVIIKSVRHPSNNNLFRNLNQFASHSYRH